jgi:hypothetical protein
VEANQAKIRFFGGWQEEDGREVAVVLSLKLKEPDQTIQQITGQTFYISGDKLFARSKEIPIYHYVNMGDAQGHTTCRAHYYDGTIYLYLLKQKNLAIERWEVTEDLKRINKTTEIAVQDSLYNKSEITKYDCQTYNQKSRCILDTLSTKLILLDCPLNQAGISATFMFDKMPRYESRNIDFNKNFLVISQIDKYKAKNSKIQIYDLRNKKRTTKQYYSIMAPKGFTKTPKFTLSGDDIVSFEGNGQIPVKFYKLGKFALKVDTKDPKQALELKLKLIGMNLQEVEAKGEEFLKMGRVEHGLLFLVVLVVLPSLAGVGVAVGYIRWWKGAGMRKGDIDLEFDSDEDVYESFQSGSESELVESDDYGDTDGDYEKRMLM